jgi:hypothetical protein
MGEIWQLSAAELAHRIARRQLSSVEVVNAHLARIDAVNPALNASRRVRKSTAGRSASAPSSAPMKAQALVAINIRRLRVGRGLSQEALATKPTQPTFGAAGTIGVGHGARAAPDSYS